MGDKSNDSNADINDSYADINDFLEGSGYNKVFLRVADIKTMRQPGIHKRRVWWGEGIDGSENTIFQVFKFILFAC